MRTARQSDRTRTELIEKLGLAGYFLIVWDIVRFCQENNILAKAVGQLQTAPSAMRSESPRSIRSAWNCSSNASFPRSAARWPDIDIDLPSGAKRERVIQYVYERYGGTARR